MENLDQNYFCRTAFLVARVVNFDSEQKWTLCVFRSFIWFPFSFSGSGVMVAAKSFLENELMIRNILRINLAFTFGTS